MNSDRVAQTAQLAMLIELSSSPKPGNVDRCHDFDEINFQHFLISAVSAYPSFKKAASRQGTLGELMLESVSSWRGWNLVENTHFGSLTLLIPLTMAAGNLPPENHSKDDLRDELHRVLNESSVEDAVNFYAAFQLAGARVTSVEDMSLDDPSSVEDVRRRGKTLLDLMKLSQGHDLVAREWATVFERSFRLAESMENKASKHGLNDNVVLTYLEALAEVPDSLVSSKFGLKKAKEISKRAGLALDGNHEEVLNQAIILDQSFIKEDVNPGSTADLIASALFIALVKGTILRRE